MKTKTMKRAERFYLFLLRFYPRSHQEQFQDVMMQSFRDHYKDMVETEGKVGLGFWFSVVIDELKSVVREQTFSWEAGAYMKNSWIKQGLFFGGILAVYHLTYQLINNLAPADETRNNILNFSILIVPLLCCMAGYLATKKGKHIKQGIYAGVLTGGLSIGFGIISLFIITFLFMDTISHNTFMIQDFHRNGVRSMQQFVIDDAMGAAFVGTFVSLISGALFGAIGAGIRKVR